MALGDSALDSGETHGVSADVAPGATPAAGTQAAPVVAADAPSAGEITTPPGEAGADWRGDQAVAVTTEPEVDDSLFAALVAPPVVAPPVVAPPVVAAPVVAPPVVAPPFVPQPVIAAPVAGAAHFVAPELEAPTFFAAPLMVESPPPQPPAALGDDLADSPPPAAVPLTGGHPASPPDAPRGEVPSTTVSLTGAHPASASEPQADEAPPPTQANEPVPAGRPRSVAAAPTVRGLAAEDTVDPDQSSAPRPQPIAGTHPPAASSPTLEVEGTAKQAPVKGPKEKGPPLYPNRASAGRADPVPPAPKGPTAPSAAVAAATTGVSRTAAGASVPSRAAAPSQPPPPKPPPPPPAPPRTAQSQPAPQLARSAPGAEPTFPVDLEAPQARVGPPARSRRGDQVTVRQPMRQAEIRRLRDPIGPWRRVKAGIGLVVTIVVLGFLLAAALSIAIGAIVLAIQHALNGGSS